MDSSRWYDRVKDRRYGLLFFNTLMGSLGGVVVFGGIFRTSFRESIESVLPVALILAGLGFGLVIWGMVPRGDSRVKLSRLSSDEIAKARSKLLKNRHGTRL